MSQPITERLHKHSISKELNTDEHDEAKTDQKVCTSLCIQKEKNIFKAIPFIVLEYLLLYLSDFQAPFFQAVCINWRLHEQAPGVYEASQNIPVIQQKSRGCTVTSDEFLSYKYFPTSGLEDTLSKDKNL